MPSTSQKREKNARKFGAFPAVDPNRPVRGVLPTPPTGREILNMRVIATGTLEVRPGVRYRTTRLVGEAPDGERTDYVMVAQEFGGEDAWSVDSGIMLRSDLIEDIVRKIGLCLQVVPSAAWNGVESASVQSGASGA